MMLGLADGIKLGLADGLNDGFDVVGVDVG